MANRFEYDIDSEPSGTGCVLTVRGDIDLASATDFEAALRSALDRAPSSILIDLAALTFIDSSGLRVLVALSTAAQSRGATLGLRNVPRHAQRVLDITGLTELLDGRPES